VPQRYSSQTFIDASARLDEACAWLAGLGISHSPTRVGRYQKIFSDLARHQAAGTFERFFEKHSLGDLANAAHEVAEVVRIYDGLARSSDPHLAGRLRLAIRGHELHVLDDDARSGRDFSFELLVASKVERAGLQVDFGHQADLRTEFEGFEFFLECKRPRSAAQVQARIKEGLKQLHRRFAASARPDLARGLLAINISKLVNAKFGVLRAADSATLGRTAGAYTHKFIDDYGAIWQSGTDSRILGALVTFDVVGIVGPTEKLETCHDAGMSNSVPLQSEAYDLLHRFGTKAFTVAQYE